MEFSEERKAALQKEFDKQAVDGKLSRKQVHELLFKPEERKEYGLRDFEEDMDATNKEVEDMTWADVVKFLDDNM